MACLIAVFRPTCCNCDELAEFELRDRRNERHGTYCDKHAKKALAELHAKEVQPAPAEV